MSPTVVLFYLIGILVIVGSSATAADDGQSAIRHAINDFIQAYNAGNIDRVMSVYSDDFVDRSEGTETIYGLKAKQATAERLRKMFQKFTGHLEVRTEEIAVEGNFAYDCGVLTVTLMPKEQGESIRFSRRFLEVWRKETDGKWRVIRAMDNDLPTERNQ